MTVDCGPLQCSGGALFSCPQAPCHQIATVSSIETGYKRQGRWERKRKLELSLPEAFKLVSCISLCLYNAVNKQEDSCGFPFFLRSCGFLKKFKICHSVLILPSTTAIIILAWIFKALKKHKQTKKTSRTPISPQLCRSCMQLHWPV